MGEHLFKLIPERKDMKPILIFVLFATSILISGCSDTIQQSTATDSSLTNEELEAPAVTAKNKSEAIIYGDKFPEVLAAKVSPSDREILRFHVTLSSPYDSPERYADAWRVLDGNGNELGIRVLGHDHASEQPFTRSGTIEIPTGTYKVYVEGRDQANGWSGQRFEVELMQP